MDRIEKQIMKKNYIIKKYIYMTFSLYKLQTNWIQTYSDGNDFLDKA